MLSYWNFFRSHPKILGFAFLHSGFSAFGQTFFIALFIAEVQKSFALTSTEFGSLYSAATLAGALSLPWMGKKLDQSSWTRFSHFVGFGLLVACLLFATAYNIAHLFIALLFLRLFGQGLMIMIATTSMAKVFSKSRGKAVALAMLGAPVTEAIFPFMTSLAILHFGWKESWFAIAGYFALFFFPLSYYLAKGMPSHAIESHESTHKNPFANVKSWTQKEVLKDPRFYMLLPAALSPPFFLTGFFFHQQSLLENKSWLVTTYASAFVAFAGFRIATGILSGPLIDRFTAHKLFPFYLLPLALGFASLGWGNHPAWSYVYLALCGFTVGMGSNITTAVWAEMYGTQHLGAIRGMFGFLAVCSTALSPPLFGWYFDHKLSFSNLAFASSVACIFSSFLIVLAYSSFGFRKLRKA